MASTTLSRPPPEECRALRETFDRRLGIPSISHGAAIPDRLRSAPSPTVHLHVLPRRTATLSNDIAALGAAAIDLLTGEDRRST